MAYGGRALPGPAGGAYSAPQTPLLDLGGREVTGWDGNEGSKGREMGWREKSKGKEGKKEGKGMEGKGRKRKGKRMY